MSADPHLLPDGSTSWGPDPKRMHIKLEPRRIYPGPSPQWQKCPVCGGRGWMPGGYFTGLPLTAPESCKPCHGKGMVATP